MNVSFGVGAGLHVIPHDVRVVLVYGVQQRQTRLARLTTPSAQVFLEERPVLVELLQVFLGDKVVVGGGGVQGRRSEGVLCIHVRSRLDQEHAHIFDAEEHRPLERRSLERIPRSYIDVGAVVQEDPRDLPVVLQDCQVQSGRPSERESRRNERLVRVRAELHVIPHYARVVLVYSIQKGHAWRLRPACE